MSEVLNAAAVALGTGEATIPKPAEGFNTASPPLGANDPIGLGRDGGGSPEWPTATEALAFKPPTRWTCPVLDRTKDDEPIFVLRAQDVIAPFVIRAWADTLENLGGTPAKVAHARACARAFVEWGHHNTRKLPD